jgi:CRISPR/Cas system-associated exonuclease Cas4 (RecB family)
MSSASENLSYSRAWLYKKCKRAYAYQYLERLSPARGTVSIENWIDRGRGILIHAGLESGLVGRDIAQGIAQEIAEIAAGQYGGEPDPERAAAARGIADECAQIAQDVLDWLPAGDFEPITIAGKPAVEACLTAPISGFKQFIGFTDVVLRHKPTGRTFVADYKTTTRFKGAEGEIFRLQMILYLYALKQMGIHVDGALIIQIKPTLPKGKPRKIRVDEGGVDAPRESVDGRFQITPTLYSATYVQKVWEQFDRQAADMAKLTVDTAYANVDDFACSGCDFRDLCMAELNGGDVEWIRANKFNQRGGQKRSSLNVVL